MWHFITGIFSYYTFSSVIVMFLLFIIVYYLYINLSEFFSILFTQRSSISDLKEGKVKIKGVVKRKETEIEKYKKAYQNLKDDEVYHKEIKEEAVIGKNDRWREVSSEIHSIPFYVEDNSDEVLIQVDEANFEFEDEQIIGFDQAYRSKHYSIKNDMPILVLGEYCKDNEDFYIAKSHKTSLYISTKKESKLLILHGLIGFSLIFLLIISLTLIFFVTNSRYKESWEGEVVYKYKKKTDYMIKVKESNSISTIRKQVDDENWSKIKINDYVVKEKDNFFIKIVK